MDGPLRVLDAGCGNGRFGRAVAAHVGSVEYTGIDSDPALVDAARRQLDTLGQSVSVRLAVGDLLLEPLADHLDADASFDCIGLFGVLHHVPGEARRIRLLTELAARLAPGGRLAASVWRLDHKPRFDRKRLPWDEHNRRAAARGEPAIDVDDLEPGDHLLTWSGDLDRPRYCHFPTDAEIERWLEALSNVELVHRFHADGREGDDNLYLVWGRP